MSNLFSCDRQFDGEYMLYVNRVPTAKLTEQDVIRLSRELLNALQVTAEFRERKLMKENTDAQ